MARLAGDKPYYTIALLDSQGKPTDRRFEFPSVTHILDVVAKPALYRWYFTEGIRGVSILLEKYGEKIPTDVKSLMGLLAKHNLGPYETRDAAATLGKKIHGDLENLCLGKPLKYPELSTSVVSWWDYMGFTPETVVAAEKSLVSFTHRIAGTVDIVYRDPTTSELVLADLKTGSTVPTTSYLQLAAYKLMWEEEGGETIGDTRVIHCPAKKSGWSTSSRPELGAEEFLDVLDVYKALWYDIG